MQSPSQVESQESSPPPMELPVTFLPQVEHPFTLPSDECDLKLQNQQLRRDLNQKQQECQQKDQIIAELSNSTKLQEKKIDLLTAQLGRVEMLMQELIKQTPSTLKKINEAEGFLSPSPKHHKFHKEFNISAAVNSQLKWDSEFLTSPKANESLHIPYLLSGRKKPEGSLSSPYLKRTPLTFRSKHQGEFGQPMDLGRYRREMLMNSKTLDDVIRLEKFMAKKQGHPSAT